MSKDDVKLDPELLEILVCPLTRSPLRQEGDELVAEIGGLRYPILIEEARLPEGILSLDEFKEKHKDHIPD